MSFISEVWSNRLSRCCVIYLRSGLTACCKIKGEQSALSVNKVHVATLLLRLPHYTFVCLSTPYSILLLFDWMDVVMAHLVHIFQYATTFSHLPLAASPHRHTLLHRAGHLVFDLTNFSCWEYHFLLLGHFSFAEEAETVAHLLAHPPCVCVLRS